MIEAFNRGAVGIRLLADAGDFPTVQSVSEFVYDLNLVFELHVLDELEPGFLERGQSWRVLSRTGRRAVPSEVRLRARAVHLGSPLELAILVPLIPIVLVSVDRLAQSVERIYNIPARRRDLLASTRLKDAQADAYEADAGLKDVQAAEIRQRLRDQAGPPVDASNYWGRVDALGAAERRLRRSLRIVEFEVTVEQPDDADAGHQSDDPSHRG